MSIELETRPGPFPATAAEGASLALVDTALGRAALRRVFTRVEAVAMLEDVRASVVDPALGDDIAAIVNDAITSYDDKLLAKTRVVDPLLDVRLALAIAR